MSFRLVSLTENPDIPLDKPIVLVGRHEECDVQINSRKISRKHCCIAQVNDYVVVRDLFSTNGLRINGERVEEGSLHVGDELSIAHFRYQVALGQKDAPTSAMTDSDDQPIIGEDNEASSGPATEIGYEDDSDLDE